MDFKNALEFIYKFKDWERGKHYKFDLSSFREFLDKIKAPHSQIKKPFLIAGTKGKGSTVQILSSIFRKLGKTGAFTSPHLVNICERIKVNDNPIPEHDFVKLIQEIKPWITDERSTFEILTSLAFLYFVREKTEFSIFEVGLGGRLDATNVLEPEVSVLTPISFDHTDILGDTLRAIANEKCGIMRKNGKVVSSPQDPEILGLIKEMCKSMGIKLWVVGEDIFCEDIECSVNGSRFRIKDDEYFIPLLGRHQVVNALTAICVAQVCNVSNSIIKEGLSEVKSPGRLEIVDKNPWVVFDGAHNVASAWVLRRSITELFNFRRLILVFGVLKDKDKEGIIHVLAPIVDHALVTPIHSPRSSDPYELLEIFRKEGVKAHITKNPITALKLAKEKASPTDLILVSGSMYLVGELLSLTKF
ncbi:MAG: folylpolyglutamate synthase/dihydrofolate synthase family protein [bacterium]|nr:folylpolyglutamate synthase/dihydrofolate synthase family protein [bacterium]